MHTMKILTTSVFMAILLMLNESFVRCEGLLDSEVDMNLELEVQVGVLFV